MCTQFLEKGEFCEKCAEALVTESFVEAKTARFNEPKPDPIVSEPPREQFNPGVKKRDADKAFIWIGIGGSTTMIFFSLLIYAFPMLFEFDAAAAAAREAAQALEDCRLVFEEIGYLLEEGELPDASMTCPESNMPNIVTRSGDVVRVSHPNPEVHGLSEIYVTSDSHEVIFVERSQG